ncbi:phosphopantetheine-binding protein [Legionella nautarum]|uniref:phosphopantetheine-binding protein n=1 Tax=Legionella nautarum TaxID=45070 RepID=UPI001054440B
MEDNFFDLGGDSLIALQIITVLKAQEIMKQCSSILISKNGLICFLLFSIT